MNSLNLIDTLKDLKENRRLSTESEGMIKPFIGMVETFSFSFLEASSTFSSRLDERYSKGKTVVAKLINYDLECSILFPISENNWVESLGKGEEFDLKVRLLELDNLYQRAVFGKLFDADEQEHSSAEQFSGEEEENASESSNFEKVKPRNEDPFEDNSSNEGSFDNVEGREESSNLDPKDTTINQGSEVDIQGNLKFKDGEPNDSDLDKEKTVGEIGETIPVKAIGADQNKKKDDSPIKQDHPPSIPSLKVQKKAKEIDRAELERIRDKRYEEGAQSLTEEENQILSLASARDKKFQPIQFKKATNFNQAQDKRAPNKTIKDEQNIVTIGCRGIFGIITAIVGLQALGNGWLVVSIVTFGIAWYLLQPVIEKFK